MPTIATKRTRRSAKKTKAAATGLDHPPSAFDRFKPYIGVISGPGDLSTNPKYMEGYGRSRRP